MKKKLKRIGSIQLPTNVGQFQMVVYENKQTGKFANALVAGEIFNRADVLTRVHSSCLTGDVFGSLLCDCGLQLEQALRQIKLAGTGVLIYLDQEGRGVGLGNKILAMALQEQGLDTVDANVALGLPVDARNFQEAAEIIKDLGIKSVRLLTNNPSKVCQLRRLGVKVSQRLSCVAKTSQVTKKYLTTKKERLGHLLPD